MRKILRVTWTARKTNEWVLNTSGTTQELLDFEKARKLTVFGHIMRKQGDCLKKEIMLGTMSGRRRSGRRRTAWINNISSQHVEQTCRGGINQNDKRQRSMENVRPLCK